MDLGLNGRTALVSAASQGLGKAIAERLAHEGARVIVCARDVSSIAAAVAAIRCATGNDKVQGVAADVTQVADIDRLAAAVADLGGADILINNAGGPPPGLFDDLDDQQWQQAFELTLLSAIRLTRKFLPHMRAQRWGRIVNITSYSVKQPIAQLMLSNSIRLGVIGWAKTLANEVAPDGVLVNNVCPGWIETDRVSQLLAARAARRNVSGADIHREIVADIPLGRMGRPEELADVVTFLASDRAAYVTGVSLAIDGGTVRSVL